MSQTAVAHAKQPVHHRHLCIALAQEQYALAILDVCEIQAYKTPTPLPHLPAHIRGVANLSGAIVPVIDLRQRLGLPAQAPTPTTVVVFVKAAGCTAGLVVDAATRVIDLSPDDIAPAPDVGGESSAGVRGLARHSTGFVIILDIARLLSTDTALATIATAA